MTWQLQPRSKNAQYLFSRLGEPQSHSGHFEKEGNLLTLPGIKPQIIQPAAYSLYYAIIHHDQNYGKEAVPKDVKRDDSGKAV
jgi:hypothetical protein